MKYAAIKKNDVANGPGVRVSLFVSGCRHGCRECFNREAWDFGYGRDFDDGVIAEILDACDRSYIEGLSLLGGEPFEPENQEGLLRLLRAFEERFPHKSVWCYTGFVYERELLGDGSRARTAYTDDIIARVDVLVDGRYEADKRDLNLRFRGSSNQRLIDMDRTRECGHAVLWDEDADTVNFHGETNRR